MAEAAVGQTALLRLQAADNNLDPSSLGTGSFENGTFQLQRCFSGSLLSREAQALNLNSAFVSILTKLASSVKGENSNQTHLPAAFSIDVDGRGRSHGGVFHLSGLRTVLKNPGIVPEA